MKRSHLYIIFMFFSFTFNATAQNWLWANEAKLNSPASVGDGTASAIDGAKNVYIMGDFIDTVFFGTKRLITTQAGNIYIVKYDSTGKMLWTAQSKSNSVYSFAYSSSITTDKSGNAYVVGEFYDTVSFGSYHLYYPSFASTFSSMFIVKYSPNGKVLWAKQPHMDTNSVCSGSSISIDNKGNIYVTGNFGDTVKFGNDTLISDDQDIFLAKYDSNGNVIWARQSHSPSMYCIEVASSLAIDNLSNIYVTGNFQDSILFDKDTLKGGNVNLGFNNNFFLVKYDSSGNVLWAKQSSFLSYKSGGSGNSIALDNASNAYITGYFRDSIMFDNTLLSVLPSYELFLVKYSPNGNFAWAKQAYKLDTTAMWSGFTLSIDTLSNIYLAGGAYNSVSGNYKVRFDSTTFTTYIAPNGDGASLLLKLDTTGNLKYGVLLPFGGDDANPLICDQSGKYIYWSGDIYGLGVFGSDSMLSQGDEVPFVARIGEFSKPDGVEEIPVISLTSMVFPNPSKGIFTIQSSVANGQSSVEVYNMLGEKIASSNSSKGGEFYSLPLGGEGWAIDLNNQPNGIYLYRINSEDGNLISSGKLIIQK
ncbi:MAG: T9SS type A sorting domain-containing protein [Bacteroidia bacterium]